MNDAQAFSPARDLSQLAQTAWRDPRLLSVAGMGFSLPGEPLETSALLERIDARFGLDVARRGAVYAERLGIKARHICRDFVTRHEGPRPGHSNPELAAAALRKALEEAGLKVSDLGYLIGHTASPARLIPSNIALVADLLGFEGPHMELRQACTGFANACVIAQGLLASAGARPIAIVGSETGSVYFDPARAADDQGQLLNLVQMGDAAAAIILAPEQAAGNSARLANVYYGQIGHGRAPGFSLMAGGSNQPFLESRQLEFEHSFALVRQSGAELFASGIAVAASLGSAPHQVDFTIPHQANGLLAELMSPYLQIAPERIFVNADKVGNTGSAAIWLALAQLRSTLTPGQTVLTLGVEATKYMFGGFAYTHG